MSAVLENVNILLIILFLLVVFKIVDGYKKGIVKEIIAFISIVITCIVIALIAKGIHSYLDKQLVNVVIAFLLLAVIGIVHQLLGIIFFSAKMISKLPIIHWADKLLGVVFGVAEVFLILWTLYLFTMILDMGKVGQLIISYTKENNILVWLYEHNYLAYLLEQLPVDSIKLPF